MERGRLLHTQEEGYPLRRLTREQFEAYLGEIKIAKTERKQDILRELARSPEKTRDFAIDILKSYKKMLLGSAALVLQELGYPQNASAIPWLVNVCTDQNAPGLSRVIDTLKAIPVDAVAPFFIEILLKKESPYWSDDVSALHYVLRDQHEWLQACAPAFVFVLAQVISEHLLDPDDLVPFVDTLELLLPECTYAIPVLLRIAQRESEGDLAETVRRLLSSLSGETLKPYSRLLPE